MLRTIKIPKIYFLDRGLLACLNRITAVDFVLENDAHQAIGIEVKASHAIYNQDFRGLRKLATSADKDGMGGVILYREDQCLSFGERLWAILFSFLD